jgi:phosphoribosyl 1,2-cyclic phosphodiesterase
MESTELAIQTIASSSKGNLALVRTAHTTVMLDIGLSSQKAFRKALADAGVPASGVAAALVSHCHSDHLSFSGLRFCEAEGIPVLAAEPTLSQAVRVYRTRLSSTPGPDLLQLMRPGSTYLIRDLEVTPFQISHDVPTLGYVFATGRGTGRRKLAVATDLGCAGADLLPFFTDADAIVLEANYDDDMMRVSERHPVDIARVKSDRGHLSNSQSGAFLRTVIEASSRLPRAVVLAHLSQDHNEPERAVATVRGAIGSACERIPVTAAPAFVPGGVVRV